MANLKCTHAYVTTISCAIHARRLTAAGIGSQMGILESDARWLFQQLLIAVDYCHRLGIANRDIKVGPQPGSFGKPAPALGCLQLRQMHAWSDHRLLALS
jgi:hypothetical protein